MATMTVPGISQPIVDSYERVACDTVQSLTVPDGARFAVFMSEAQTVRFRDDGGDASSTSGVPIPVTGIPYLYVGNLHAVRFCAATAGGFLNVLYYA